LPLLNFLAIGLEVISFHKERLAELFTNLKDYEIKIVELDKHLIFNKPLPFTEDMV